MAVQHLYSTIPASGRDKLPLSAREATDPRFESLSGTFDQGRFRKQYNFLYEEALPQQRLDLKSAVRVSNREPTNEIILEVSCIKLEDIFCSFRNLQLGDEPNFFR